MLRLLLGKLIEIIDGFENRNKANYSAGCTTRFRILQLNLRLGYRLSVNRRLCCALFVDGLPLEALGTSAGKLNSRRNAHDSAVVWYVGQDHTVGDNHHVVTDLRVPDYFGTGSEIHVVANALCSGGNHDAALDRAIRPDLSWAHDNSKRSMD